MCAILLPAWSVHQKLEKVIERDGNSRLKRDFLHLLIFKEIRESVHSIWKKKLNKAQRWGNSPYFCIKHSRSVCLQYETRIYFEYLGLSNLENFTSCDFLITQILIQYHFQCCKIFQFSIYILWISELRSYSSIPLYIHYIHMYLYAMYFKSE